MNKNWKQKNYDKLLSKVNVETLDKIKEKGFTNVNNSVITMDIPSTYKIVYMAIQSLCYGNKTECMPSNSTIAYLVNKSVRTVQRAVSFLREANLISTTSRKGTTNIFKILHKVILSKKNNTHFYKENKPSFNNFEPREYDYDELEKKLLGWDNDE